MNKDSTSVSRVFPASHLRGSSTPHRVPLSILDSAVARFSPTCATWIYDPPKDGQVVAIQRLVLALEKILDSYPHWAGQLHFVLGNVDVDHTQRFGRSCVLYGVNSDPGIELVIAQRPEAIVCFVPTAVERKAGSGWWNAGDAPLTELIPSSSPLALHDLIEYEGLPAMLVQVTTFGCGGYSISIKLAHILADAQTLIGFAHGWAAINRALINGEQLPSPCPLFDPRQLDRAASGNIDGPDPDPALIEAARALPSHRYDLWASSDGCPPSMAQITKIPPELNTSPLVQGDPLPWSEWDLNAPVSHYLVSFTADEVKAMWEEALSDTEIRISRLDALLAHVWILILRARELSLDQQPVYLDVTLGVRSRLSPPLPETFVGSPIILAKVTTTGVQPIGEIALSIRSALSQFNASNIGAILHALAFEVSPHRIWTAFLGRRNTIITSWLRLKVYEVDFGTGVPRFVDASMPSVDGCVHLMENGDDRDTEKDNWYDETVSVSLHLRTDVLEKFLNDPDLRKYRKCS